MPSRPKRVRARLRDDASQIEPLLLNEHQAAQLCGVSFWTLRELVQAGEIPTVDFPSPLNPRRTLRRRLIDRRDLEAFIARCKRPRLEGIAKVS